MRQTTSHRPPDSRLATARVLVIGVGGLGAPCAAALAAAGIGTLGLMDPDHVELSNLHRQPLYGDDDLGAPKAIVAAQRLASAHPGVTLEPIVGRFVPADGYRLRHWDVVVDGTDTVATKFQVNDAAVAAGVPLVHAGAIGWQAQLLTVLPHASACYRCLFEDAPPAEETPACDEAGVLGPIVNFAGTLQAAEVVRLVRGEPPLFADRLLTIDARSGQWRRVPVAASPACITCGTAARREWSCRAS